MKKYLIGAALVVLVIAMHDLAVPVERAFGARAAIAAIDGYRATVSPRLKGKVRCRFQPTCSAYGREVIRKRGLAIGGLKTVVRIAKCGPWTKAGTVDKP